MIKTNLTHRELCEVGAALLRKPESANGHGCHFSIVEPSCYGENPDVFGIRHGNGYDVGTILLEAKTSRSDFLADKKKPHRIDPATGIGKWRYFICPTDLIQPEELPERWGLIYVSKGKRCKYIKGAMAVPKEKYDNEWNQNSQYWRNGKALEQSFIDFAFNDRNVQNEFNLLTMALARLRDPEKILYMQRNFTRLEMECQRQAHEIRKLQQDVNLNNCLKTIDKFKEQSL
ncbi:adenylosuccinate synthase [Acinetobacter junii]|uniref:Adenylosuccinate synthase n=1 Tax=Acinetobacter junii TaxID=40215 RepID=A0AAW5R8V3_ACIJU|nr:adenylosuccinate synthase [Acinetobacter junii]MCU4395830.1 adenylosuccinate synthase [Acinetobacter junii]